MLRGRAEGVGSECHPEFFSYGVRRYGDGIGYGLAF